jgi:threonyl-tRNA synthetase
MAVQRLFPETRVTIGPSIETGFYYDFDRAMVEDRPPRAIAFTPDDLTRIEEEAGGGLVFWHPKGARMRLLIEDYWRNAHLGAGYDLLYTPHIANLDLRSARPDRIAGADGTGDRGSGEGIRFTVQGLRFAT